MKNEVRILLGIAAVSILALAGAVYLLSKNSTAQSTASEVVDERVLMRPNSNKLSDQNLKVTIVEFGDYQCPACAAAEPTLIRVLKDYQGKVNFVYRNFPLSQHKNALPAARAAESAGVQGRYWEMNQKLYGSQESWAQDADPTDKFVGYAKELGLNEGQFKEDLKSGKFDEKIRNDYTDGITLKVNATPTFFINNKKLNSNPSYDQWKSLIDPLLK